MRHLSCSRNHGAGMLLNDLKFCEVCGFRFVFFSIPGEKGKVIRMCEPCVRELFEKVMTERSEATVQ